MEEKSIAIPSQVLLDKGLLESQRVALAALYMVADDEGFFAHDPNRIAEMVGRDERSIRRHLNKLLEWNYIGRHEREDPFRPSRMIPGYRLAISGRGGRYKWAHGLTVGSPELVGERAA